MSFRDPVTSLPFSAITGQVDPATQVAPGIFPGGVIATTLETAQSDKRVVITSSNQDRVTLHPTAAVEAGLAAVPELVVDTDANGNLVLFGPQQAGHLPPQLDLFVTNFGGAATLAADDYVSLQGGAGGVQITGALQVNGNPVGYGYVNRSILLANTTYNAGAAAVHATALDLAVTLTAGRRYRIRAMLLPFSSVAGDTTLLELRDSATGTDIQAGYAYLSMASRAVATSLDVVLDCVSSGQVAGTSINAGAHTFQVWQSRGGGTGNHNLAGGGANPCQIVVEDIGGA